MSGGYFSPRTQHLIQGFLCYYFVSISKRTCTCANLNEKVYFDLCKDTFTSKSKSEKFCWFDGFNAALLTLFIVAEEEPLLLYFFF